MKITKSTISLFNGVLAYSFLAVIIAGCAISDNEIEPQEGFTRIYNDESFENTFEPLDIIQTADSGYLILGSYDLNKTYLLRTNKLGYYEWDLQLEEKYVNPIPGIISNDSAYYFFCMDELTLETYMMQVNENSEEATIVNTYPEIIYPLYASKTADNGVLLLSYDRNTLSSKLTKLNGSFQNEWDNEYPVIEDVEEDIIAHVSGISERLPFFTGTAEGKYFFNGYSNYSFSLHFVNKNDGGQTGVINGFRDSGAISAAINLSGSEYALTRYSFGENFILSRNSLGENSVAFSSDLGGNPHPEIEQNAFVHIRKINIEGTSAVVLSTTTRSGQIILYLFDEASGELKGSKRFGFTNPYSAVEIIQTYDNGIAILGNTFVTGRFSRICLFKLSENDLAGLMEEQ